MTAARFRPLLPLLMLLLAGRALAQEDSPVPFVVEPQRPKVQLQELEGLAIGALRQQFPRPSGIMATVNSCRLPDYGPFLNINLQLPPIYFTGPVLKELEKRSREAELQAERIREQIDRAAQIIRMKAREAELLNQINFEEGRKKSKVMLVSLRDELETVRKNIGDLENRTSVVSFEYSHTEIPEMDLEKMMSDNYQEAIRRIITAMQNIIVESAVDLEDLGFNERISIATHVRYNFLSGQKRSIILTLKPDDIGAYRSGKLTRVELRRKVLVKDEVKE